MKFLGELKHIEGNIFRVGYIHHSPFSSSHGMGKSKRELEDIGILVDDIPKEDYIDGKFSYLCFDKGENRSFYKYEDIKAIPKDEMETIKLDVINQKNVNDLMADMIDVLYLKSSSVMVMKANISYNESVVNYLVYRCLNIYKIAGIDDTISYLDIMTSGNLNDKEKVIEILSLKHNINLLS